MNFGVHNFDSLKKKIVKEMSYSISNQKSIPCKLFMMHCHSLCRSKNCV